MKIPASLVLCVLLSGCAGVPNLEDIRTSFLRKHPGADVVSVDGHLEKSRADFYIHYLDIGDGQEHEEVWDYYHTAESWLAGEQKPVK